MNREPITDLNNLPFGYKLQAVRRARGLTVRQLSELSGVSTGQISYIENGRSNPSIATLEILCKTLNIDSSIILDF